MSLPVFSRLKIQYAVGMPVPVEIKNDKTLNTLDAQTPITVNVFYRAKPISTPVLVDGKLQDDKGNPIKSAGLWNVFKDGFSFTPSMAGHYTVTLTGVILSGKSVASVLTMRLEDVCTVSF